jgi:hypothetical protein
MQNADCCLDKARSRIDASLLRFAVILFGTLALYPGAAAADDFSIARQKIEKIEPNINYTSFCSERPSGADKVACRIKSVPSVGFLVCKESTIDQESCEDIVDIELANLAKVKKQRLSVIKFDPPKLGPVQCAEEKSKDCYGYLVGWVSGANFANIDHAISNHEIALLADEIVKFTTPSKNLAATRRDINAIANFMTANGKFSRICDLQGFYLRKGGFLISDVPQIFVGESTKPVCGDPSYPSYDDELAGIESLANLLKPLKR